MIQQTITDPTFQLGVLAALVVQFAGFLLLVGGEALAGWLRRRRVRPPTLADHPAAAPPYRRHYRDAGLTLRQQQAVRQGGR